MYNPAFTDEESTRRRDFDERPYPARLVLIEQAVQEIALPPAAAAHAPITAATVVLPAYPTLAQTSQSFMLNKEQHVAFLCMGSAILRGVHF
jgi:hypothetical protein